MLLPPDFDSRGMKGNAQIRYSVSKRATNVNKSLKALEQKICKENYIRLGV